MGKISIYTGRERLQSNYGLLPAIKYTMSRLSCIRCPGGIKACLKCAWGLFRDLRLAKSDIRPRVRGFVLSAKAMR